MNILRYILIVALLSSLSANADRIELPDLGDPSESSLSIAKEKEIGRDIMLQIRENHVTVDDLIVQEYISSLGHQLVSQADSALHDFTFFTIKDNSINAFALPGGYIGVNAGLITTTEDESELAAVMAHEISHVTQRHIARAVFHNETMQAPLLAAMIAGILLGGDAARAAITAASAGSVQSQINFTRKNEYEADRVGIDLLGRAGFDAYSMASLFDKMHRQSRLYGGAPPEFLSTHPVHGSRISDARARAGNYPRSQRGNSEQYRIVRARLRVLMSDNPTRVANDLERALKGERSADTLLDRYALVFALIEAGQLEKAVAQSEILLQQDKLAFYFQLQRADIDLRLGRDGMAIKRIQELRQSYPDDYVLTLEYARMLIQSGQAAQARKILEDYLVFRQGDPNVYLWLSHACKASGDTVKSHIYMAEHHLLFGDASQAISHLEAALRSPIQDYHEEASLQAQLRNLREQSSDDKKEKLSGK
ncbi:MAG: M48 family metalloprotease [Gammaproteobacteria bacterium]|nr:M48 family metalloprotease [Gammaproteobacteria bacterium]